MLLETFNVFVMKTKQKVLSKAVVQKVVEKNKYFLQCKVNLPTYGSILVSNDSLITQHTEKYIDQLNH